MKKGYLIGLSLQTNPAAKSFSHPCRHGANIKAPNCGEIDARYTLARCPFIPCSQ
jgi:hypothetical protein